MVLLDSSSFIGQIIFGMNLITGSTFLTLFYIMVLLFVIAAATGIPLEGTIILFLPLTIVIAAFTGEYYVFAGIMLIYGAFLVAKNMLNY